MPTFDPTRRRILELAALGAGAVIAAPFAVAAIPGDATVTIVVFNDQGERLGRRTVARVVKTAAQWQARLSTAAYRITRQGGTERAFTGKYFRLPDRHGLYRCICCNTALYDSATQFHSGTGWPSFWQPIAAANVTESRDTRFGMTRTGIACSRCAAHLGHKFHDGPQPTGLRYCMNSAALVFRPIESATPAGGA